MLGVLHLLSQILGGLAFAMLVPAAVALVGGDAEAAESFLLVTGLTGFVAGAIFFALKGRRWRLSRVAAMALMLSAWVLPPFIAAIPISAGARVDYLSALFEAVSGYTTTGATALPSIDALSPAIVFWRAELQWLGGLITLLSVATILAPAGVGGLTNQNVALLGPASEGGLSRSFATARTVAIMYAAATALCFGLLVIGGIPAFEAICIAFATISTGGFMPGDGSLAVYGSAFVELVVMLFMLIGATSIVWHRMIVQGRWPLVLAHRESYWVIGVALLAGFAFAAAFAAGGSGLPDWSVATTLRHGVFVGVSIVSTTGFEPWPGALAALPVAAVAALGIIGGGTMSTAGGIKFYRIGGMFVQSMDELRRLIYPHSVRSTHFGSQPYDIQLMKAIWTSAAVALALVAAATLLLSLNHPAFHGGALAAISAFSNVGPLYSAAWDASLGWPDYASFDPFSKLVMIITMIVGRVEAVALLILTSLAYWRS
jgi:trk system potassium uptake protein TrkH